MACSYGPGRYDLNYEEKGIDYPVAYVRWTEKRNMEAFQQLISKNSINIDYLTTHEFDFENAKNAFDLVVNKTEPFIGIALKYDFNKSHLSQKILTNKPSENISDVKISFIGAGSYAQGNLLPNLPDSIQRNGVLTNTGTTSKRVAEKFNFNFCTGNENEIFDDKTNTIFIATRHDSHAKYVIKGLESNKNIFVEKPICLISDELELIKEKYYQSNSKLMVGFNRRFSPFAKEIKARIQEGPMAIIYRVNAGQIPFDSWIQDIEIGGGRIIGEVCHFIDFLTFINGSLPVKVSANALPDPNNLNDTVNISIVFENGSTGIIAYYSNGSKELTKEYLEIFSSGTSILLNDFKELKIFGKGKTNKSKSLNQNKGQKNMIETFINDIKTNQTSISFEEIYAVTKTTFKAIESIQNGGKQIEI